jgi:hypothetical protein
MISMIYHKHEVEVLSFQEPNHRRWRIAIKVRKKDHGAIKEKIYEHPETYFTQKEAIENGFEYGKALIDGELNNC